MKLLGALYNSDDKKALVSNFMYLSILQIASYVFPLLTFPYLTRIIGAENFGKLAFALVVVSYFQTIVDWGFNFSSTRDVARNRNNICELSRIFTNVTWARMMFVILSLCVLLSCIILVPKFNENGLVLIVTFLYIPCQLLFPEWLFQGLERMKYVTLINLFSRFLFTCLVFIVIKSKDDYFLQPVLVLGGQLVAGIVSYRIISKKFGIRIGKPCWSEIKQSIISSFDLFINSLMPNLYNSLSLVLLGFWRGDSANGLFEVANKFVTIAYQFLFIFSRTFFPYLSRRIDKHQLYVVTYLSIGIIMSFTLAWIAPYLIGYFFTEEYLGSILILRILSFSIFFLSLSNVYGTNYLIIVGKERLLRNITFVSSIIGFCLAVPLVYQYGLLGAAVTITVSRAVLGLLTAYYAISIKKTINYA